MGNEKSHQTARVVAEHRTQYVLRAGEVEYRAVVRGKFHLANGEDGFPKVGDYVEFAETTDGQAVIENILPRKSSIIRKESDGTEPQVIVTNVDIIFIVMGLDADFNLRRLERYLALAEQSNIKPVIVLNKSDVAENVEAQREKVAVMVPHVPIHVVSAKKKQNMEELLQYFDKVTTAVLLGSSGAGKSTITNWFLGADAQSTQAIRADDGRGKHTTTSRELFILPKGGYLIDTPGIRELGLYSIDETDLSSFADIDDLMTQCEYADCDHEKSAGCAVQKAVGEGVLDAKRLASYLKLKREQEFLKRKVDERSYAEHRQMLRTRHKNYKKIQAHKRTLGEE